MPLTIITTPGDSTANSFVSRAEFVAWCERQVEGALVPTADGDAVDRALVEATARLAQEEYAGQMGQPTQALPWPRWGVPVYGYGDDTRRGVGGRFAGVGVVRADVPTYDATTIPRPVVEATCTLAALRLRQLWTPEGDATIAPNTPITLGDGTVVTLRNDPHALPPTVLRHLRGLWRGDDGAVGRVLRR